MRNALRMACMPACVLIAVGSLALNVRTQAREAAPEPSPVLQREASVVATVDLVRVFEKLNEARAADDQLARKADELTERSKQMADELAMMEEDLALYTKGSAKYEEALEELAQKSLEYRSFIRFGEARLDLEKSGLLKDLYLSICTAVESFSEREGVDVVIVDDSVGEIQPGSEEDTMRQLAARRVLYSRDTVDITDDLIAMMNQQFGAAP
ncbi:MAG: OmpH family outer membrane protein [Planctomycetota bacterium]